MPNNTDPSQIDSTFKPIYRQLPNALDNLLQKWTQQDPLFAKAIDAGSPPAAALGALGVRLCLENRYADSIDVLNTALDISPDAIGIINDLAVVYERAGATDLAIRKVERSLTLRRAQGDSWIFLGNLKQQQGDLPAAATAFEIALSLDSTSVIAWQCLGIVRQAQHEFTAAIECFRACIRLNHAPAPVLSILGQLFYSTGQFEKSKDAYTAATEMDPSNTVYRKQLWEMRFICSLIAGDSIDAALNTYIIHHAGFTLERDADALLHKAFALLSSFGHTDAARTVSQKRLELFPGSPTANYFAAAIAGQQLARSPDPYIIESFDSLAERFDAHLTSHLGYDIPEKLAAELIRFKGSKPLNLLDAGCGTGLCGPHVRAISSGLTGVDLSPRMLDQARKLKLYDSLICEELTTFLTHTTERFDAIIAADVLIYFGDLAPLAAGFARALLSSGLLAFSTEIDGQSNYQLRSSGRFAHHPSYVRAIFEKQFEELSCRETTVRTEATLAVLGTIFVFRRRSV